MQIIVSSTFSPEICEQCHSDQTPDFEIEGVEEIAGETPLPPDVVIDASQRSEPVAPPSPHPPSPRSPSPPTVSEDSISEGKFELVCLGSYRVHPNHASSIPICLGMVLTEQTANSIGVPWDKAKTHWFDWDTTQFRNKIESAIIVQISEYNEQLQQEDEEDEEDEDELETQGGKRKRVDLDSPANKRLHLDLDDIELVKDTEVDTKVSQFCFRVAVTDHHTVVASEKTVLDRIFCSVINLLYRQECVYYNYKSKRREHSLLRMKIN